jgi:hypothetical protein
VSGKPWGVKGVLCIVCYNRHRNRVRKARVAAPAADRLRAASAFLPVVSGCPCRRFRMRFRVECDLCGVGGAISLYSGAEFEIEGRICHQCREELRDERAEIRAVELRSQPCYGPDSGYGHAHTENRRPGLPVLTPGFTRWDLVPRAAAALILAETKPVFARRASA